MSAPSPGRSGPRWCGAGDFEPPLAAGDGVDVYRRRIVVHRVDTRTVICNLEDDFHHFEVTVVHNRGHVVDVHNESHRWPWATCPGAGDYLRLLIGAPLSERFTDAARFASAQANCTHQFDAAAHAITLAARGREYRQYDAEIGAVFHRSEPGSNRLWVDGRLTLDWLMFPGTAPELGGDLRDAPWKGGFMRWADEHLDADTAECAIVLRRACDIGMGRGMPLDSIPIASDLLTTMGGVCHSMQPHIAPDGVRNVGSIRDFASHPHLLAATPDVARPVCVRG